MKQRVLIVDDSLTVRMDLSEAFEASGFEPHVASDLAAARRAISTVQFDLLVLDVLLPDGDGVTLLAELRDRPETARLPVMMLSSEAEVRDRVRGLSSGADEYVGKPYDTANVTARARTLIRRQPSASSVPQRMHILLIDDSPTFSAELGEVLDGAGYEVSLASSGEDGLRLAGQLRPEAIIVDGSLPGIDGPTVIRRVRLDATLQRIPCVLLTGADDYADEVAALDAGADAYLRKGATPGEVLARLASLIRSEGGRPSRESQASLYAPKRVMAVDDSATFLNVLSGQLRKDGYDVVAASSGEEAIELLGMQTVDCVLLDLVMPGLSGMETCRQIKAAPSSQRMPVIILTGHDDQQSMLSSIEAGADDYVPKSSDYAVLRARLRAQLRRQQYEAEHRRIREELMRKELEATEARAARVLAEARAELADALARTNAELQEKNRALLEANLELDAFTYSVSHDLRAPLRSIDGFSRLLLEEHGAQLDPAGRDYLERIQRGSEEMSTLISSLLELSRVARADMETELVDLVPIVQKILDDLRAAQPWRDVQVTLPDSLVVRGDPRLLRILLTNLLSNAWKFTRDRAPAVIQLGAQVREREVEVYVRDNGVGFDPQHAHKLFGVFQRLHKASEFEGTGIGLTTVRRIAHRHGGRVRAETTPAEGATFAFTLPGAGAIQEKVQ